MLAPLAALITVRVSVHASIRGAIERSAAVVLGVLVAVAIGDTLGLNALTVGLLTSGSLAFALLVLRLPRPAANQIPVSALVVMAALAAGEQSYAWERAFDTVLGAAVGVAVSLALPASRLNDARESMRRLATVLGDELDAMGDGLCATWSTTQTAEWRHTARLTRQRLVEQMTEAVGNGREAAQWNLRDRPHVAELGLYEDVMPRLERTAIGVWAIARGLEDHAQLTGGEHRPMEAMGALLASLGDLVRVFAGEVLGDHPEEGWRVRVQEVPVRRAPCARGGAPPDAGGRRPTRPDAGREAARVDELHGAARAGRPHRRRPARPAPRPEPPRPVARRGYPSGNRLRMRVSASQRACSASDQPSSSHSMRATSGLARAQMISAARFVLTRSGPRAANHRA